ncbi:MAG: AAA family ATPase [Muribaculaceae bacterium]
MENKTLKRLPVGIQTYEKLVEQDCLYIDKTEYICKMINFSNYIFLSRPRRFGKSLLVSTLQAYFEGKKELFKGTYIDTVEKDWTEYPVLRFDLSMAKHLDKNQLERYLLYILEQNEARLGLSSDHVDPNVRMANLIREAYYKTGKKVVVLIDEYDAPLLDVAHEKDLLTVLRNVMRNFYSPLKASDPYLKFVFITGITKFSQLSIFSELNNLRNISMLPEYAAICGITKEEMLTQMSDYIDAFARALEITPEEAMNELQHQYDGYHFTWPSPDIFNPFSLLNAFLDKMLNSYWFESGTPTFLIEKLKEFNVSPSQITRIEAMASAFDAPTESMKSVTPLLYQAGYVTIKDYDRLTRIYTLDIPNQEIRIGLMESLLPNYVDTRWETGMTTIARMFSAVYKDDLNEMLRLLQAYLLTIPQCDNTNYEGHYQQLLYVIFSLLGRYVDVEVRTATGRVDMVMNSGKALYLIELKLNKSAEAAMNQINLKDYPSRFALSGLPITKIGINFNTESHTIEDWKIEA